MGLEFIHAPAIPSGVLTICLMVISKLYTGFIQLSISFAYI